jgi:hypothetical protein
VRIRGPLQFRRALCYAGGMIGRLLAGVCGGVILMLCGCSSMGGGKPAGQAQVVVSDVIEAQIQQKAEDVFFRHGFECKGTTLGRMEFERSGGTLDNILYGNWQEKDITTSVTLFITPQGPATCALRVRAMAVRNSFGGDSDTKLFDIQGAKYKVILNKIAKELSEENAR